MKKQDTFPGFGDIPDEPDGFGDILQRQLYDLILTTLHAFRLHADTPEQRKASPLSLELRLPARVFDLQDTPPPAADSPDFLHHGNELLLRLFYSYDVNEITADVSGYDPELADRIRRQAQDLVQERCSELTPEQRKKLMQGATEKGMDAANRLLADAMKKADTLQGDLDTQRRTIIFIADSTEEPPYPCSLEGFRQAIRDLTYPPAEQFIHPAAMAYQAMQKEDVGKVTLSFDFTDREGADRRRILKGSLSVHFFPLFLDISAAFVDPDAFPQGPELTAEQAADVERQIKDAQETQDFFRNLLTIAQAFFPVVVSLDTGGVSLDGLPEKERAAFWEELLGAAARHFFPEEEPGAEHQAEEQPPPITPDAIEIAPPRRDVAVTLALACQIGGIESLSGQLTFDDYRRRFHDNIPSIISSLTSSEHDLLNGICNLQHVQGGGREVVIHSMQELAEACHIPKYKTARGREEYSGRQLMELYQDLLSLPRKVFPFSFVYMNEAIRYTAPFYRIAEWFRGPNNEPFSDNEIQAILKGHTTPELLGKLRDARVMLDEMFTLGRENAYLYRPEAINADIRRMAQPKATKHAKRVTPGFRLFVWHIVREQEWLRRRIRAGVSDTWETRPQRLRDLATTCGLHGLLAQGHSERILKTLKDYAQKAMNPPTYITAADFTNPDKITFTINDSFFQAGRPNARPARLTAAKMKPGRPVPETSKAKRPRKAPPKPARTLPPEEQADAEALYAECADIFRNELPAMLAEIGVPIGNADLSDEDIQQGILRPYIEAYSRDAYGPVPATTDRRFLNGLRMLCKTIVKRKKNQPTKIKHYAGYLARPQRTTDKNPRGDSTIQGILFDLLDDHPKRKGTIHRQKKEHQAKLAEEGPEGYQKQKGMQRKLRALALWIGAEWPAD